MRKILWLTYLRISQIINKWAKYSGVTGDDEEQRGSSEPCVLYSLDFLPQCEQILVGRESFSDLARFDANYPILSPTIPVRI